MATTRSHTDATAATRQALIHADAATGRITASSHSLREDMRRKGYAATVGKQLFLTRKGWRTREFLLERHQEFRVNGVPWSKIDEITDLYLLTGLGIDEIAQRTRMPSDEVAAVLSFRKVLSRA